MTTTRYYKLVTSPSRLGDYRIPGYLTSLDKVGNWANYVGGKVQPLPSSYAELHWNPETTILYLLGFDIEQQDINYRDGIQVLVQSASPVASINTVIDWDNESLLLDNGVRLSIDEHSPYIHDI